MPRHARLPAFPHLLLCLAILSLAGTARLVQALWTVDADGLSVVSGTLPTWDFTNLWAGGRLALAGRLAELQDPALYRAALSDLFGLPIRSGEWSYPPPMLLVGAVLGLLPIHLAYGLWTIGTVAAFAASLRVPRIDGPATLFALAGPAVGINGVFGQNGALTGALLLGGLGLSRRRPWIGGVLVGLLCVKPHLGLLAPVVFVADRNPRAFAAAALTATACVGLSAALFGVEAWTGFLARTAPMMRAILEADFGEGYQVSGISPFLLARALGFDIAPSYVLQAAVAVTAAAGVWTVWRSGVATEVAVAATVVATFLASPYGYTYDLVPLAAVSALLVSTLRPSLVAAGLAGWIWPALARPTTQAFLLPLAPLVLALEAAAVGLLAYGLARDRERERHGLAAPRPSV